MKPGPWCAWGHDTPIVADNRSVFRVGELIYGERPYVRAFGEMVKLQPNSTYEITRRDDKLEIVRLGAA